jgi:hypothetical protein
MPRGRIQPVLTMPRWTAKRSKVEALTLAHLGRVPWRMALRWWPMRVEALSCSTMQIWWPCHSRSSARNWAKIVQTWVRVQTNWAVTSSKISKHSRRTCCHRYCRAISPSNLRSLRNWSSNWGLRAKSSSSRRILKLHSTAHRDPLQMDTKVWPTSKICSSSNSSISSNSSNNRLSSNSWRNNSINRLTSSSNYPR